jgi:hypothetical protein
VPAADDEVDHADASWPRPWRPLNDRGRARLTAELRAELAEGHDLYGTGFEAVARCDVCDHVVVASADRWLVVHLTWRHPDRPPWPSIFFEAGTRPELLRCTARDGHDEDHAGGA